MWRWKWGASDSEGGRESHVEEGASTGGGGNHDVEEQVASWPFSYVNDPI